VLAANRSAARLFADQNLAGARLESLVSDPPATIAQSVQIWSETGSLTPVALTLGDGTFLDCEGARLFDTAPASIVLRCVPRTEANPTGDSLRLSPDKPFQNKSAEKLALTEQQNEAADITAAMFAHEVANPLNGIATCLDVLELEIEKASVGEVVPELLRGAKEEIVRLTALLNDFRAVARPQLYDFRPVDLANAVREVLASDLFRSAVSGIEYDVNFAVDLPPVRADNNRLKQAMRNLFRDAIDAMPHGGRLRIAAAARDGVVLLELAASGSGAPPGVDQFQLFRTSGTQAGALGLPMAAQIIAAHQGRLEYRASSGQGTTFTVHLPIARD
jgi:signal transduction histidine kinase